jgi:transposase
LSTKLEKQIQWRRSKVAELDSQGHSQPEMASILQVSIGTKEPDYNEDEKSDKEGEEKQEQETGE